MTKQGPLHTDLLQRRLTLVGKVAELNSELLKLSQLVGGTEMEALRIQLEVSRDGAKTELVQNLHELEEQAAAIRSRQAVYEDQIAIVEGSITEIDRLLEESARS